MNDLLNVDNDKDSLFKKINDIPKNTPLTKQAAEALRILQDFFLLR